MGIDIHMFICKNNKMIAENIFDGRNSEWFANLQNEGWDDEYYYLPNYTGLGSQASKDLTKYLDEVGYYGFYHINVKDFKEWFQKYRPDKAAGWVTSYDAWRIKVKHLTLNDINISNYLPENARIEDMHFIEVDNPNDCSKWLYDYLIDNEIDDETDIVYFFDC